jgi:hypothetical protein
MSNKINVATQGDAEVKKEHNPYLKYFDEALARIQNDVLNSDDPKVVPVREVISPGFYREVLKRPSQVKP